MKHKPQTNSCGRPGPEPLMVSLVEAAQLLAVSKQTVERMIADGSLPARRLRRRRMIPRKFLLELAEAE